MFEPNSIRSLLKKRNMSKLSSQNEIGKQQKDKMSRTCSDFSSISKNNTDPDLQSVIQAKMMIKQIDHQVQNIRTWRQHQKQLLKQRLQNNTDLYNLSNEQYERFVESKLQQELKQNKKIIQRMKISQNLHKRIRQNNSALIDNGNSQTIESSQNGQIYQDYENNLCDQQLMANITQGDDKINKTKYMKSQFTSQFQDNHTAFLQSINELSCSDIFSKKNKMQQSNKQPSSNKIVDKDLLRQELDDIDKQLRQMEDLLRD